MTIYSRSSIQSINNWKLKCIIEFNKNQPDIDKTYYAKDSSESKYQYLVNKLEKVNLKHCDDPKVFFGYSNDVQDVYKNIKEYSLGKKRKILIVFYDMIADMINN